jgi:hypothetical protein
LTFKRCSGLLALLLLACMPKLQDCGLGKATFTGR